MCVSQEVNQPFSELEVVCFTGKPNQFALALLPHVLGAAVPRLGALCWRCRGSVGTAVDETRAKIIHFGLLNFFFFFFSPDEKSKFPLQDET